MDRDNVKKINDKLEKKMRAAVSKVRREDEKRRGVAAKAETKKITNDVKREDDEEEFDFSMFDDL